MGGGGTLFIHANSISLAFAFDGNKTQDMLRDPCCQEQRVECAAWSFLNQVYDDQRQWSLVRRPVPQ